MDSIFLYLRRLREIVPMKDGLFLDVTALSIAVCIEEDAVLEGEKLFKQQCVIEGFRCDTVKVILAASALGFRDFK